MSAPRRIGVEERRARLGVRQRLAASERASNPVVATGSVVALHATDAATVFLSAAARMSAPKIDAIERALYEERSLIRMLGMRRTMFVVPTELLPVVHMACTLAIAALERRRTIQLLEGGVTKTGRAGCAKRTEPSRRSKRGEALVWS